MFSFVTENVLPVQIIKSEGNLQNSKNLLVDNGTNIWVREDNVCTINGKGYIVFDFGKEYHGGARILTHITSLPQVEVRLRFGESLSETFAEIGEKGACNDHSIRDFKTLTSVGAAGLAVSILISVIFIPGNAYDGANAAILISLGIICLVYFIRILFYLFNNDKNIKKEI